MKNYIKSTAVASLLGSVMPLSTDTPNSDRCLGLAMSGGGALGAYEAGALWGMYNGL